MFKPLKRAAIYVPAGSAALSSVALMNIIPAVIAGVSEIIVLTPPDSSGKANPDILAATKIAGAHRVFKIGGAQAVAAAAYGTESVPKVDKIAGPGNAYVTEAKRQVFGSVGIDMLAGPSDITIIADHSANAEFIASDMIAQAEHDKNARAVLLTTEKSLVAPVLAALEDQLKTLPRHDIAKASLLTRGLIVVCGSLEQCAEVSNKIAPEHLEICTEDPETLLKSIENAGSIFLGHYTPEVLGDYLAGPNNTLPTEGTARFASPVSVDDFIKKSQITRYSRGDFNRVSDDLISFAKREGLDGHARSALIRNKGESE